MKSKQIIIMLLSVLVFAFAFASCKSNENPEGGGSAPFKVSSIVGTWNGDGVSFTIDNNRNVKMTLPVAKDFQIPETDWNSEKTEYTIKGDDVGLTGASITFKSATSGTATRAAGTTDIKKQ